MAQDARRALREARYYLRRGIDYFDFFRRGEVRRWNDAARQPIYMNMFIPVNLLPQADASISDPNQPIPNRQYLPFSQINRTDDGAGRTVSHNMRINIESLGWRMVKILGAGSQGLAVLFESVNDGKKVVFKWGEEVFSMAIELWAMRQMVGARHIIQVRLRAVQTPLVPDFQESGRWPSVLRSHISIIIIYPPIGSLDLLNSIFYR